MVKPLSRSVLFDTIMENFGKHVIRKKDRRLGEEDNAAIPNAIEGTKVLLVEDNPTNQEVAEELLNKDNVKVSVANNGK